MPKNIEEEYEEFVYMVSHDLSSPLTHVREFTKLLMDSIGDNITEDEKLYKGFIDKSLVRIDTMQKALLELSRSSIKDDSITQIDTDKIVQHIIDNLNHDQYDTRVSVSHGKLPTINGNHALIKKLFTILIDNACRYSSPDVDQIVIIQAKTKEDKTIFQINDNGIGIEPDFYESVFTMFRRLHNQEKYGGGAGAGLAISKRIIDSHGGEIWIEPSFDKGANILFSIPHKIEN